MVFDHICSILGVTEQEPVKISIETLTTMLKKVGLKSERDVEETSHPLIGVFDHNVIVHNIKTLEIHY